MQKRQQVLDTALELISELGFHATPMSLIIKKSGAAAGTIYHHFKNKEDLIDTLYSELRKESGQAIVQGLDRDDQYKNKFILIWKNLFYFYSENRKKFEYLENYANSPFVKKEVKAISRRNYQAAIDFFESGIQMGILRNMPVILLTEIVFNNVATFTRMILLEEIEFSEDLLSKTIQSSWDSIKIN
jgi:AcrR family transcriptional regulator